MTRLVDPVHRPGTLADRPQPVSDVGGGLVLRPWSLGDVGAVVAAYADPQIRLWHHVTMTDAEAAVWIEHHSRNWLDETDADWAVALDDEVVGRVALRGIDLVSGQAEVTYWTLPTARRHGVARRAAEGIARWALTEVGFWRLEVRHSTLNALSCRVATTAGFEPEATLARAQLHEDGWHDVHVHSRFCSVGSEH